MKDYGMYSCNLGSYPGISRLAPLKKMWFQE